MDPLTTDNKAKEYQTQIYKATLLQIDIQFVSLKHYEVFP